MDRVLLDSGGRVAIPADVLSRLGLSAGAPLSIETPGDREIRLVPVASSEVELLDEGGVLVAQCIAMGDLERAIEEMRDERVQTIWGAGHEGAV